MVGAMRRAAADLDVELEEVECHRDHARLHEEAGALVARQTPPDYLLLVNEQGLAVDVLPKASARGINVLLLNEGLMVHDRQILGRPGELHATWLGELVPDDRRGGYLLAKALVAAARRGTRRDAEGRIVVGALGGSFTSSSLLRINGLRQAVAEEADAELVEVVPANWEIDRARTETANLLERNPDLSVLWSASDHMALGAAEALAAAGRAPGGEVALGGVDWAPFAFDKVRDGTFTATVGGHFLDGAWALVLLYDLHHRPALGPANEKSRLALVTRDNVDRYDGVLTRLEDVDFGRFSKVKNAAVEAYDFSVDAVL
jgi:ABC-type sugar transport system substrate-binding protein